MFPSKWSRAKLHDNRYPDLKQAPISSPSGMVSKLRGGHPTWPNLWYFQMLMRIFMTTWKPACDVVTPLPSIAFGDFFVLFALRWSKRFVFYRGGANALAQELFVVALCVAPAFVSFARASYFLLGCGIRSNAQLLVKKTSDRWSMLVGSKNACKFATRFSINPPLVLSLICWIAIFSALIGCRNSYVACARVAWRVPDIGSWLLL